MMRRHAHAWSPCIVAMGCSLGLLSGIARAEGSEDPAKGRRVEAGAELGYAFPIGSLERGSRVSDVVRGLVPLSLEAGYSLSSAVVLVAHGQFAIDIPKLCATASDCMGSLGRDIALGVGGRFRLPKIGPVRPELHATFGYEWFRSELTDNGVTSARDYRGPILANVQAFANFTSGRTRLGPFISASGAIFAHRALVTPAFSSDSSVDETTLHGWLQIGFRVAMSF